MNIVLVNPIGSTIDVSLRTLARPRIASLVDDGRTLRETNIVELGSALAALGHHVTVVLASPHLAGREHVLSSRLRVVPVEVFLSVPFHPAMLPMTPSLLSHPSLSDAEVIQASEFHQPSTFLAAVASRERQIPLFVWQEAFRHMRPPGAWYESIYETIAGRYVRDATRRHIPRTTMARDYLRTLGVKDEHIGSWIPTGIDTSVFAPRPSHYLPEDFGWAYDDRILLVVARLHSSKGVDIALRTMSHLLRKASDVRLIVRGSGPELVKLRQLAIKLKILDAVRIVGRLSRDEMVSLYNLAHVVVCTSRNDLLPFALMEAGACGRPVVAADVGAIRDIVVDRDTGLVVGRDERALGEAILTLLGDEKLHEELGLGARRRVEQHFDVHRVAARLFGVYTGADA